MAAISPPKAERISNPTDSLSRTAAIEAPSRLRVLQVLNGEHYAGIERVVDLLAMQLPQHGVDVGFACIKPDRFPAMRMSQATPLVTVPMRSRFDFRPAMQLARLVRQERCDLLHTQSARALLLARLASALSGVPLVHHVHGNTGSEVAGRRYTKINAFAERLLLPGASAVIAVSQSVAEYLRTIGITNEQLRVIPNGVPARPALSRRAVPGAKWRLGFIALLRPRKGLEAFLEAAALLRRKGLPIELRIVGRFETPEYEQAIHRRAAELQLGEAIEWRGFRQQVDRELDQMDLLVFPSVLPEGMPMVVLEAMAAGTPIVATRVAGVTDVLGDEDALLVEAGDATALAEGMAQTIADAKRRESRRRAAFHRQSEWFSDQAMARSVAAVYRSVVAQKGAAR